MAGIIGIAQRVVAVEPDGMVVVACTLSCNDLIGLNAYDNTEALRVGSGDEAVQICQSSEWIVIGLANDGEVAGAQRRYQSGMGVELASVKVCPAKHPGLGNGCTEDTCTAVKLAALMASSLSCIIL